MQVAVASLADLPLNASSVVVDGSDGTAEVAALDSAGWLGGSGACLNFDAISFSLGGHSVSIDVNNSASWCYIIAALGAVLLAMSYFKAAQIIMRG